MVSSKQDQISSFLAYLREHYKDGFEEAINVLYDREDFQPFMANPNEYPVGQLTSKTDLPNEGKTLARLFSLEDGPKLLEQLRKFRVEVSEDDPYRSLFRLCSTAEFPLEISKMALALLTSLVAERLARV